MIVVLATKGQVHPYRETSILTDPGRYLKKAPCPRCNGSGIAYCCQPEAQPLAGDIEDQAGFWKLHYNTPLGGGTVSKYMGSLSSELFG